VDYPGTNCGLCGDPISQPMPSNNEIGGVYYNNGIINRAYNASEVNSIIQSSCSVTVLYLFQ
jgi:hypothetical protein